MMRSRPVVAVCVSIAAVFVLSACSAPAPPAEPMVAAPDRAADEAAIRDMFRVEEEGVNARDFSFVESTFTPDGDLILMDRPKATGPQAIQAMMTADWAEAPADRQIDIAVDAVRFLADDVAMADVTAVFTSGNPMSARATGTMVRTPEGWKWAAFRIYPAQAE